MLEAYAGLTVVQGMRGLLLVLQRTHIWPGLAHQLRHHPALSHGARLPATVTCRARCCASMAEAAALPASSVTVLKGKADSYDGVLIDATQLPASKGEFAECLLHSLEARKRSCCFPGLRFGLHGRLFQTLCTAGVAVSGEARHMAARADREGRIYRASSRGGLCVPPCRAELHHVHALALPRRQQAAAQRHSPGSRADLFARHRSLLSGCACKQQRYLQVGVGAFVLNERREVLVVQEKNGPLRGQAHALCMAFYIGLQQHALCLRQQL